MNNLLREFIDPNTAILSKTDKMILATIQSSPTPELAYENTNGNTSYIVSRNKLYRFGFIQMNTHQCIITDNGKQALITNNLIDENDQLTDEAVELINSMKESKKTFAESISIIRDLLI